MGASKSQLHPPSQQLLANYAAALAHPARLAIIDHLIKQDASICVELSDKIGLAQPTITQHLKVLRRVGLIRPGARGSCINYRVDPDVWTEVGDALATLFRKDPMEGIERVTPDENL